MAAFYHTVIVGGGLSGLAAARGCGGDFLLLEAEERLGGLCRSELISGFTFDRTGHLLHLRTPRVRRLIRRLLPGALVASRRDSFVFSHGVFTRYPFQSHFFGLPPAVAAECLLGTFEARRRHPRPPRPGPGLDFERFARQTFGAGVANHFLLPYNRKLWTLEPRRLTTEWLGRFVPRPELREVVLGALADRRDEGGYNAEFFYPRAGGIEALVRALARSLPETRVRTSARVTAVDLRRRRLRLADGEEIGFGRLVSSAPLPEFVRLCQPLPEAVQRAARRLRWVSVFNLNLGVRDHDLWRHWVYLPEDRFAVYRVGTSSLFAPGQAPPGMAAVYTEVAWRGGQPPPDPAALERRVVADLIRLGVLRSERDVRVRCPLVLPTAYAIYDRHRSGAVRLIRRALERREIYPLGRYGRWEYSSMEDALSQGLELADNIL